MTNGLDTKNKWWKKDDVKKLIALTIIFTPVVGFLGSMIHVRPMGAPASKVMETTQNLITIFTWAVSPVVAMVCSVMLLALLGKRHYGDNPPEEADHDISNSPRANATWIVVSAILCLFAVIGGMIVLQHDNESILDDAAIHVNVHGQQWAWNYDYPESNGVRSGVLHLPVNQPVVFHVTSADVKHSFWIVELGTKIDANPGAVTEVAVTPNKIGTFNIRCAELCGLYHAYMQNKVIVESQEDFDAWLGSQPRTDNDGTKPYEEAVGKDSTLEKA